MEAATDFARGSRLLTAALAFAREAHESPEADDTPVDHPVHVAGILHEHGYGEEVLAAALLHDVVEDTPCGLDAIGRRFGVRVRDLVATMTEDASIDSYGERKAEHRRRLARAAPRAAAIFAADKLAKVRELSAERSAGPPEKLDHYRACLEMLRSAHPDIPFLDRLDRELGDYLAAVPPLRRPAGSAV